MVTRIGVIALNTYREAVRARTLHGLFALSLATAGYCLVVGEFALQSSMRVVSDLGAASLSLYGVIVAVVLGATSLHRELEHKTIFPILARPIRRTEYLVGKYLGSVGTLAVFVVANAGVLLLAIGARTHPSPGRVVEILAGTLAVAGLVGWRVPRSRTWLPAPLAVVLAVAGALYCADAPDERRVIVGAAALTIAEVGIVVAVATVFSSFSSPFLTALFTFGIFPQPVPRGALLEPPPRITGGALGSAPPGVPEPPVEPEPLLVERAPEWDPLAPPSSPDDPQPVMSIDAHKKNPTSGSNREVVMGSFPRLRAAT
jgi:hypothetical protein